MLKQKPFIEVIREGIAVGEQVLNEQDPDDKGIFPFGADAEKLFQRLTAKPKGAELSLLNWLKSLSQPELAKIQTVMYWGRDRTAGESLKELHAYLANHDTSVEALVRTISEKSIALATYLKEAVKRATEERVDLETWP